MTGEPDGPARDPVVRAIGGLATGAADGAAVIVAGLLVLRTLQHGRVAETQATGFTVLAATLFAGVAAAILSAWLLSRGITVLWRRAVTAALAVCGAILLSLVAVPADVLAGRAGLGVYLVLLVAGAAYALAQARRAA
jgi:hypothetical protein